MDSKHPYSPHFPPSNKAVWPENPAQFSPSIAPNSQHKQANDVDNLAIITTTPVCDVSTSLSVIKIIMES